jgi:hypothetical protein
MINDGDGESDGDGAVRGDGDGDGKDDSKEKVSDAVSAAMNDGSCVDDSIGCTVVMMVTGDIKECTTLRKHSC